MMAAQTSSETETFIFLDLFLNAWLYDTLWAYLYLTEDKDVDSNHLLKCWCSLTKASMGRRLLSPCGAVNECMKAKHEWMNVYHPYTQICYESFLDKDIHSLFGGRISPTVSQVRGPQRCTFFSPLSLTKIDVIFWPFQLWSSFWTWMLLTTHKLITTTFEVDICDGPPVSSLQKLASKSQMS